jgi:hypothetical protein
MPASPETNMTGLPEPLTPPECDVRGYEFMPVYGARLFSSSFYAESNDAEFRAGFRLHWAAWQQCPAGSLPTSDNALAILADYGRNLKGWLKVKERALHGFILCSDGRLYHPFLSMQAVKSYEYRLKSDVKRAADRARLKAWRDARRHHGQQPPENADGNADGNATENGYGKASETQDETRFVAGRKEKTRKEKTDPPSLRSAPPTRRTRVDADWWPSPAGEAKANECGVSNIAGEVGKFRDYHSGKGSLMADWDAAWRTWCGNTVRFGKPALRFSPGPRGALEAMGLLDDEPTGSKPLGSLQ